MKLYFTLLLFSINLANCWSQSEFNKPWEDLNRPIIIDVYKDNSYDLKQLVKDKRIKGIIHKMSEEDSAAFYLRRKDAYEKNLLFGSYWLPKHDYDGAAQADLYLKMIGDSALNKEFIALDFEEHKLTKEFISPYNASLFIKRIYEKTGRYPHIYCGLNNMDKLTDSKYVETFNKCKLWLIALPVDGNITGKFKNNTIWNSYSLWQFSCEINCCKGAKKPCYYKVNGIDCYMDYDIYNGTFKELTENWGR
ncbi:hypothetical protein D0809_17035 [Flavobacterium circumlabens]|uniref:Glycosyl hydrolase family 25 n=1 Tax=Flavobacterium circumlabens TaxID=2133765 RepID=A0A4Y7UBC2_9FLAO|nr:glycoside hydrolase family 25 protein [Flavobacterium circumlabens]TCN55450.1 glycosyl hydrolase family 25 [Flavobacterium circumlabens]TEB43139.1 hypothetical protein D0809_17035 [Flavobacterium circumlabens]